MTETTAAQRFRRSGGTVSASDAGAVAIGGSSTRRSAWWRPRRTSGGAFAIGVGSVAVAGVSNGSVSTHVSGAASGPATVKVPADSVVVFEGQGHASLSEVAEQAGITLQ